MVHRYRKSTIPRDSHKAAEQLPTLPTWALEQVDLFLWERPSLRTSQWISARIGTLQSTWTQRSESLQCTERCTWAEHRCRLTRWRTSRYNAKATVGRLGFGWGWIYAISSFDAADTITPFSISPFWSDVAACVILHWDACQKVKPVVWWMNENSSDSVSNACRDARSLKEGW